MYQTRLESFIEAWVNVFIGFGINFTANMFIFPFFGFNISAKANFVLGLIYTVISVARSYVIRRWFNAGLHKMVSTLAAKLMKLEIFKEKCQPNP